MNNSPDYIDVISIEESIKKHVPIAKHDLLYPLWAYNITLPIVANNNLNTLEKVIYELIENKEKDAGNIATLTGLNVELVAFIISRLQQLGLVNSRMQATELAKESISLQTETKYIAATVYYDIKNKAYLPKVIKEGMPVFYANKNKNKYVFYTGTSGESKEVGATRVSFDKQSAPKLTPNDALNIIRRYRNTLKKERLINVEANEYSSIPTSSIEIDNSPQLVYLHQLAFIPEGTADIFVTNGFNGSTNPAASRSFERHNSWLYRKLKEKADKKTLNHGGVKPAKHDSSMEKLNSAYQGLISNTINSSGERKTAIDNQADFFKGMYNELEHLLAKSALSNPVDDVLTHIHSSNSAVNGRNIIKIVKELGFTVNKLANYFFNIKQGTLNNLNYNDPNMAAMIALNVISADQAKSHPLTELALEQPDFFERISQLKKLRDAASHGDIVDEIEDKVVIKQWYQWIEIVYKIFGDNISEMFTINEAPSRKNRALSVSVEMDKYFNWYQKQSIPQNVLEVIQNAIKKQLENNLSDTVTDCASALQKSFYYASKSLESVFDTSMLLAENSTTMVARKVGTCELENIPHSNKERIERACQGVDSTLGANAMAFIYRAHVNDLKACPNLNKFLPVTSRLIKLRGHNRRLTESDISTQDLNKLLINVFEIINDLMERFGE